MHCSLYQLCGILFQIIRSYIYIYKTRRGQNNDKTRESAHTKNLFEEKSNVDLDYYDDMSERMPYL